MKCLIKGVLALAASAALASTSAMAATAVRFVEPEKFADVPFSQIERERVLDQLARHVEKLGATLPGGQDLRVEVLDVDLAGITYPSASRPDMRVLNGRADWPRITLRYTLEQDGRVLKSGEETLADMTYMQDINAYRSDTSLRYEKQMLDKWFRKAVAPR